jgi:Tol biopolymer transport system component
MTIQPGTRLGPYEIVAPLGAGGMGEVYRARDARLGRDVAVKLLPPAFSGDPERLQRFQQEARSAAALNHPNILAVHDIGAHEGAPYIVSELLEGETLRERLTRAPIPLRRAIEYGVQITSGLAAAHDKGIVHRDLKPDNVFVTADGRVKILDFGLAKLTHSEPVVAATIMATTPPATMAGVVLGTAGYMAPEQVRGQQVDHRADIFAFGVTLYEMLSGTRAFHGETVMDRMTAILKEDPPDLPAAERHIPPAVVRVVDRCLEKDPAARFQSTRDLAFALESATSHSESSIPAVSRIPLLRKREWLAWTLAAAAILAAITLWLVSRMNPAPVVGDGPLVRLLVQPDGNNIVYGFSIAVSPDGKHIAFVGAGEAGTSVLWVRSLDAVSARPLPGTTGAIYPFWSPDSRSIAFFAAGSLKKMDLASGAPETLAPAAGPVGGTWNIDNTILFVPTVAKGLARMQAAVGAPVDIVRPGRIRWPHFLPDGRHYLYSVEAPLAETGVYVASLDSPDRRRVADGMANAAYSSGRLLYIRGSTLVAQTFGLDDFTPRGEPTTVAANVRSGSAGFFQYSASHTGVLAFRTGDDTSATGQLTWFDRSGRQLATVGPPGDYLNPQLSHDGKRVAFEKGALQQNRDIYVMDLARAVSTRFTFDPGIDQRPIWSPDDRTIAFTSSRTGRYELYVKPSNGVETEKLLFQSDRDKLTYDWTRDGRFVVFRTLDPSGIVSIWLLPMVGDQNPTQYLPSPFTQSIGIVSPDDRWISYSSNESGTYEVYLQNFPTAAGRFQVSSAGGHYQRWSSDGRELFYLTPEMKLMSVSVAGNTSSPVPELGAPTPLFTVPLVGGFTTATGFAQQYDVAPGSQRFLVNLETNTAASRSPITVVVNWTEEGRK